MRKPTIHLNGTCAESLFAQYREAKYRLADALEALQFIDIHARDYYPQGEGAYKQASEEHCKRCQALESVLSDLSEITEHVNGFRKEEVFYRK